MAMLDLRARRVVGVAALTWLLAPHPAAAQDAIPEEAKLYFKNGVELIQAQPPNYQDAYYQFKLAWEKSKSWKVLSNWGLCALKLERDGEAIWAYAEYLKQKDIDPDERKDLERDLLLLNGNAASVTIASNVPDLEVVDARAGSSVPPQSYRLERGRLMLKLRAGSHSITASAHGESQRWEVTLSPGKTDEHRFELGVPTAAAPPTALALPAPSQPAATAASSSTPQQAREQSGGTLRTVGYVVASAGVLALGGGAFMGLAAKGKESDAKGKCKDLPTLGFSCPESARSDFDSAKESAQLANLLMVTGGVVAASGLVLIVVGGPTERERAASTRLTLAPLVGRRDAGLFASGSF